jgi:DNA topoisomerase-1
MAKSGRYGPYVTEVLPEGSPKSAKPRTASLFKDMNLNEVTLDDALRLLSLPRVLGVDPESKEEITVQNGRYGPYLLRGTDSRSIGGEEEIFTVTLEQALALYAQPKQRRGRGQAAEPLRVIGADPTTNLNIVVRDGRFGPYVTDGETNASLRTADDPMTVTAERASDLLSERRAKEALEGKPAKRTVKKAARKAPAKKAANKKSAAGKASDRNLTARTVKKAASKKASAKKTAAKKVAV